MDANSQIMSTAALIVAVVGAVLGAVNHKRLRSKCCGRVLDASFDVEDTTPAALKVRVEPKASTESKEQEEKN